jgi:hypothetical protein
MLGPVRLSCPLAVIVTQTRAYCLVFLTPTATLTVVLVTVYVAVRLRDLVRAARR